ncbi:hypothetical protein PSM36_2289 [Proteiniphilum saccharofermentans]|uniref:Uncharacterized protein n=1 Tax=Proteiniphilum saccharofermentans TaxID=1642647 RepID=A0A1R3TBX3_9BACT|nr:hypothetical protein PSM36_2289 [Proteiniphilum saccharofermentans]
MRNFIRRIAILLSGSMQVPADFLLFSIADVRLQFFKVYFI